MEGTVDLKYTTDGGTTWSTPTSFKVARLHAFVRFEPDSNTSTKGANGYNCEQGYPRLVVTIECDTEQFAPGTTGDALFLVINKLRCASMIHLDAKGAIGPFTEWSLSNNTNYLTPDEIPDIEFDDSNGSIRIVNFTLKARDPYTL